MLRNFRAPLLGSLVLSGIGFATPGASAAEFRLVTPGPEYEAGFLKRLVLGDHWRSLWTTPMRVPVLDLRTEAGGLTVLKRGGGMQTKGLRFQGRDGKEYKFRSVNKDPVKVLPEELRDSLAAEVVQDQISTSNPLAPMLVAPLSRAIGVFESRPRLVVLPDDPALGEFRADFAGVLGTFEENPRVYDDGDATFETDKIITTVKLFRRIDADSKERVDARAFLRARLLDLLIGDWDRHQKNWKWARVVDEEGDTVWRPIARDRDQAFSRYDGWLPTVAEWKVRQFNGVTESYPRIEALTWSGRHLDRRLLSGLSRSEWMEVTDEVLTRLTDAVLAESVAVFPSEAPRAEVESFGRLLRARRAGLREASERFYLLCAKRVDIHASDRTEQVEVVRADSHRVRVTLRRIKESTGEPKKTPFFDRVFTDDETRELRLYLHGGEDRLRISGESGAITVRVVSEGAGQSLRDETIPAGFPGARRVNHFYVADAAAGAKVSGTAASAVHVEPDPRSGWDEMERMQPPRDYGHDVLFTPLFKSNSSEGTLLGGGVILTDHRFREFPYRYQITPRAGYAVGTNRFYFDFAGDFLQIVPGHRVRVDALASQLEVLQFYGFGNDSVRDESLAAARYYSVNQARFSIAPAFETPLNGWFRWRTGLEFSFVPTSGGETNWVNANQPYGVSAPNTVGAGTGIVIDTRDSKAFASRGELLTLGATYFPQAFGLAGDYGKLKGELKVFARTHLLSEETWSVRAGGEKLWGRYPFYQAAFLGGDANLRGFLKNRFAGDASEYAGAELRMFIGRYRFLFPARWGLSGFVDAGRVFVTGENSDTWHTGFGAGIWSSFASPDYTLVLNYARSVETSTFSFGFGFSL